MKYSEFYSYIEKCLIERGDEYNVTELSEVLSFSRATFYNKKESNADVPEEKIRSVESHYAIDIPRELGSDIELDYYPDVFGSCGSGAFVLSETRERISVPRKSFLTRVMPNVSNFKKYSVINAIGDSMSPTFISGDKLIVEHFDGGQIKDNKVYVFCYENKIFIKRLVDNIKEIVIKSDNPIYKIQEVDAKDPSFMIIGEIVGMLRDMS